MNKQQLELLQNESHPLAIGARLSDQTPRTLTYGYTIDRHTLHSYLQDGAVHLVVYDSDGVCILHRTEADGLRLSDCIPDKRLYPEDCDFDFCQMIKAAGIYLPFTTWSDERTPKVFAGLKFEDLNKIFTPADFNISPGILSEDIFAPLLGSDKSTGLAARFDLRKSICDAIGSYLREKCLRQDRYADRDGTLWIKNAVRDIPRVVERDTGRKLKDTEAAIANLEETLICVAKERLRALQDLAACREKKWLPKGVLQ